MDLKPVVAGPDLLLVDGPDGQTTLYDRTGESLGSFAEVRDAWAAVDALDTGLRLAA